jgi:glycogen operon protein
MLTAGDEGGRTQRGNNNAYCQDNDITWMDWTALDEELIGRTAWLASLRRRFSTFSDMEFFNGKGDVFWFSAEGTAMTVSDWERPDAGLLGMAIETEDRDSRGKTRLAVLFNRGHEEQCFKLPASGQGGWSMLTSKGATAVQNDITVSARSVSFLIEN